MLAGHVDSWQHRHIAGINYCERAAKPPVFDASIADTGDLDPLPPKSHLMPHLVKHQTSSSLDADSVKL
ncbi:hypothetical protein C8035_v008854 [Colletotrichum spinosum]|uniref:Uncharacterized protein n=2 Tax=Colletotrichum orbiculare species complex TaxID=2707354 RepID=A0A4R8RP03_COLTR|nr:hypothetical protein C8035_v008854 [Colletotrichum spinosum]TDZ61106.1 hypothetical protein CTRI78_v004503 [Colletotrichum trifolii]